MINPRELKHNNQLYIVDKMDVEQSFINSIFKHAILYLRVSEFVADYELIIKI